MGLRAFDKNQTMRKNILEEAMKKNVLLALVAVGGLALSLGAQDIASFDKLYKGGSASLNNSFAGPRPYEAPDKSAGAKEDDMRFFFA